MTSKELLDEIIKSIDDKKGKDTKALFVSSFTTLSDYFVICTGTSSTHIKAIADGVEKDLRQKHDLSPHHVEGYSSASWILMDYSDVLVNILLDDTRKFYSLERLWGDAESIDVEKILEASLEGRENGAI